MREEGEGREGEGRREAREETTQMRCFAQRLLYDCRKLYHLLITT